MKGEVWGGGSGQRDGHEAGTRKHFEAAGTRALGQKGDGARGSTRDRREEGGSDRFRNAPRGGFIRGLLVRELPLERRAFVLLALGRARLGGSRALRLQLRNLILLVGPRGDVAAQAAAAPHRRSRHPARLGALRRPESARRVAARVGRPATPAEVRWSGRPPRLGLARDPARWWKIDHQARAPQHTACQSALGRLLHGVVTSRGANGEGDPARHLSSIAFSCPSRASSPSACL